MVKPEAITTTIGYTTCYLLGVLGERGLGRGGIPGGEKKTAPGAPPGNGRRDGAGCEGSEAGKAEPGSEGKDGARRGHWYYSCNSCGPGGRNAGSLGFLLL